MDKQWVHTAGIQSNKNMQKPKWKQAVWMAEYLFHKLHPTINNNKEDTFL